MQTQLINFSIPVPLLKALDTQAKREVKTRSETIRDAVRVYLLRHQQWADVLEFGRKVGKRMRLTEDRIDDLVHEYREGK